MSAHPTPNHSAADQPAARQYIGAAVRRVEDGPLLTGRSRFVEDVTLPGTVYMAVLRSPYAHARIVSLNMAAAGSAAGVMAVLSGHDLDGLHDFPVSTRLPGARLPAPPVLARDLVRYVGEPVAVAVADSFARARDALDRVEVEYDVLPAIVNAGDALAPDAEPVHPQWSDNVSYRKAETVGDVDGAFQQAAHVVQMRLQTNRVAPVSLETRGLIAEYDRARDELVVWSAVQMPFLLRADLAVVLDFPETNIRIIAPDVGGGFGGKTPLYPEDVLVPLLALRLGRPVKWIASRYEDMVTTNHGRGLLHELEAACDAEGHWSGLRVRVLHNVGAYPHSYGLLVPIRSAQFSAGAYRVGAVQTEVVAYFAHTSTTGPYRGTGRPEATQMTERIMDAIAEKVGLDPVDVRRRNLLTAAELPYKAPSGVTYDSGDYHHALDRVLEMVDYQALRREQEAARVRGDREQVGIGLATIVGMTGTSGWESATVRIERTGKVTVMTGSSPHGQSHRTVWAQVAADRLRVPFEHVVVVHGDTAATPAGVGTFGSRGAPLAASAVAVAADLVRAKVLTLAASMLEVDEADLVLAEGQVSVVGAPERAVKLGDIARLAYGSKPLPAGLQHGLEATNRFLPHHEPFAYGAFVAVVRVDTETGRVRLERMAAVDDCGTVLNPLVLHGQMHGALAQGIGQALCEQVVYGEDGQPLTAGLVEYAVPRAEGLPAFELEGLVTPTPLTPLGAKGGSEAGCIGAPASILNAVLDALRPLGVEHVETPLTGQSVWRAMQRAQSAAAATGALA